MGTVLVVDDSVGSRRLLTSPLTPDGHIVRTARNGAEAVSAIRDDPPDLVPMDVMMPAAACFRAWSAVKQEAATRRTPVGPITSVSDNASRTRGIDAGADDFLSKRFEAAENPGLSIVGELRSRRTVPPIVRHLEPVEGV